MKSAAAMVARVVRKRAGGHLAGHEAPPDQLVEAGLVAREEVRHLLRGAGHVGGPDRLVGVLDVLALALAGLTGAQMYLSP